MSFNCCIFELGGGARYEFVKRFTMCHNRPWEEVTMLSMSNQISGLAN